MASNNLINKIYDDSYTTRFRLYVYSLYMVASSNPPRS